MVLAGVPLLHRHDRKPLKAPLAYRLIRVGHRIGVLSGERLEAAKGRFGSSDYRATSGVMRDVLVNVVNEEYSRELALLECPVELVWGAEDDEVPVSVARRAAALVGEANLTVVEGVGHHLPVRRPDALKAAIEALS